MMLPPETLRVIIALAVEYGLRLADREHRRAQLRERVRWYLSEHPDASANEVYRAVGDGLTKAATLEAVRTLRHPETGKESNPDPGDAHGGGLGADQ